jgi:hypothetical protein
MKPHPILPTRLKAASPGLGYPSQIEIEMRAAELAVIDGRTKFTDADIDRATAELAGGRPDPTAPETDPALEELTASEDALGDTETPPEPIPLADDPNLAEVLIEDGLQEADHDTRVAAEANRGK